MSEYKAGGKGIAPRASQTPSWLGLAVVSRDDTFVTLKTRTGYQKVLRDDYEKHRKLH